MAAKKKNLKKFLNDFDLLLIDQRINLVRAAKELGGGMHLVMRKRKFPFPVKLSGPEWAPKDVEASVEQTIASSTYMLLGGGKEFTFPIARTEDLSVKEGVKNVMQGLLRAASLIVFAQNGKKEANKYNSVAKVTLQTTKSIPVSIYRSEEEDEE